MYPEDFNDEWGDLIQYLIDLREVVLGLAHKRSLSVKLKHSWLRQKFNAVALPLLESKFTQYCDQYVPEEEQDFILNVQPFV